MRFIARLGPRSTTGPWWSSRWVIPALMLLSTAPFWLVGLPPLIDLLGHLGRYHVQLNIEQSPFLQRDWDFDWSLIGNLGVDLLIVPMAHLFGLERAGWLIALALPPLMIWGLGRVSRALHGELTPFALAAAPLALAYPFQYGFVNYWLSCALALHAFASWVESRSAERSEVRRSVAFALAGALIWLAHACGWGVLVVLVGAFELSEAWRRTPALRPRLALMVMRRVWPLLLPAGLMILWRNGVAGATSDGFFNLRTKTVGLLSTLRDQNVWLDQLSLLVVLALLYFGLRDRRVRAHPALVIAAAVLLGVILIMPARMFGSAYADIRLWPIFFIAGLLAMAPVRRDWAGASAFAVGALAIFVARMIAATVGYAAYDRAYDQHLQALDYAPPGASILVLTVDPNCEGWRHERLAHLGSMAIVRKDAFVNSQWEVPGGLLLTPLRGRGTAFNADPSQYLGSLADCDGDAAGALAQALAGVPRDRFDYVWLLGFGAAGRNLSGPLQRLYADDDSAFYDLAPRAPAEASAGLTSAG